MGLDFIRENGGRRLEGDRAQPERFGDFPDGDGEEDEVIDLNVELNSSTWRSINITEITGWQPGDSADTPVRFVDGKDVGQVVAWVRSPEGYPVPVRLSQIGGATMRLEGREIRREFYAVERVVSMPVEFFPWDEIEGFAAALQERGYRLLLALPSKPEYLYDYAKMRRVAENRSREEMIALEEAAIAQAAELPTVVDGRLEPHKAGFDRRDSPVYGVIKSHYRNYLHPLGIRLLYDLEAGQRTPGFLLSPKERLAVLSWYVKLTDDLGTTPDWGFVRVETSWEWFKAQEKGWDFVNQLSRAIFEYRHKAKSYSRAAVSLHPIVRAEESLAALFSPSNSLTQRFYRLAQI